MFAIFFLYSFLSSCLLFKLIGDGAVSLLFLIAKFRCCDVPRLTKIRIIPCNILWKWKLDWRIRIERIWMRLEFHVYSSDSWEYHGQKANKWITKQINPEFWLESQMTRPKLYKSNTLCDELADWRSWKR